VGWLTLPVFDEITVINFAANSTGSLLLTLIGVD
jgi:hypothetical protein